MGKDNSSIRPTKTQAKTQATLHSRKITKAKKIKHMTAEEILAAANGDTQDTHWDLIVGHAIQMGRGQ